MTATTTPATTPALTSLEPAECYRLLSTVAFGRVVGTASALPLVLPVNFAVDGHAIVFRTAPNSTLAWATRGQVVAFEADDIDPATGAGWSVVVTGVANAVTEASELVRMTQLGLVTWVPGEHSHWVRVQAGIVTGRRLLAPALPVQTAVGPT